MKKSKYLPVKVNEYQLERIESIANRLQVNRSVVVRKMMNVALEDELYMVIQDIINKSKNAELQGDNGLFKVIKEYLKTTNVSLSDEVMNGTLKFISFLQKNIATDVQGDIRSMVNDQVMIKSIQDAK
jgi:hypothetical protein